MKRTLIKILSATGFNEYSIKIFDSLDKEKLHLKDIKHIIKIVKKEKDYKLLEKYIKIAIEQYSKNSYGYLEYAEYYLAKKEYQKVYEMLKKAPKTKEIKRILSKVKNLIKKEELKVSKEIKSIPKEVKNKKIEESVKYGNFEEEEREMMNKLIPDPLNEKLHEALIDLYLFFNKKLHLIKFMNTYMISSKAFTLSTIFKKSSIYQMAGDYVSSLQILTEAQKKYTGDRRVLFKIAEIYKFDKQVQRAYTFLKAGEIDNPTYGAVRRLSFEVDNLLLENARETLEKILKYELKDLSRYMNMLNRVSAYFPEYSDQLVKTRFNVEKELKNKIYRNEKYFNSRLEYLLGGRYLKEIEVLFEEGEDKGLAVSDDVKAWYHKIKEFLEIDDKNSFLGWIDVANQNESSNVLIGLDQGLPITITNLDKLDKDYVEIFIPNSIFTNPKTDKDSFMTVNSVFKEIYLLLLSKENLIIIPRHQYNWRYCLPKTPGRKISYHTHSDTNNPNWLHIQESTFSGYCSVDTKGFAGYADIASNFEKIDTAIANVNKDDLEENYHYLHNKYIKQNISKYKQDEIKLEYKGEYVFVALQVLTDVVADLAHIDGISLVETVAKAYAGTGIKVFVKRHPYCNSISLQRMVEKLEEEGLIEQTNASIHSIIENAKVVFTVNSGVGLESLMHLKPVVVSGGCDYSYATYKEVQNTQELIEVIEKNEFSIDKDKILKFLYFYTKVYIKDQVSIRERIETWLK